MTQGKEEQEASQPIKRRYLFSHVLIVIFAIFLGMGIGYSIYLNQKTQKALQLQVPELMSQFQNLQDKQQSNQEVMTKWIKEAKQSQIRLKALNKHLQTSLNQQGYQENDWRLLRARYFLELAEINIHWTEDTDTTIELLQQANTMLESSDSPSLFATKQTIAQEVTQLQALPHVDIAGVLSQLDAIESLVAELPIKKPELPRDTSSASSVLSGNTWREKLGNTMTQLKKLVIIRHQGEVPQLLMSSEISLLQESIILKIEEAKWAVIRNNQKIWIDSLTHLQEMVTRYFDSNALNTQAFSKQLADLQKISLSTTKPDLGESLKQLNQVIDSITPPAGGAAQ